MNMIATEVLLESKTARDGQLAQVSHEAAADTLSKAKALVFALWQGIGAATTQEMAEYYEVSVDAIESVWRRNQDELKSDGVITLKGTQLKAFKQLSVKLTESNAGSMAVWTPRSALRLGMLLRDSEVARQVRTVLLDVAEKVPKNSGLPETPLELVVALGQEMVKIEKRVNQQEQAIAHLTTQVNQLTRQPNPQSGLTAELVEKILEFVRRKGGTVSVRNVQRSFGSKPLPSAQQIKKWFRELENLGHGKTASTGRSLLFTIRPQLTVLS